MKLVVSVQQVREMHHPHLSRLNGFEVITRLEVVLSSVIDIHDDSVIHIRAKR